MSGRKVDQRHRVLRIVTVRTMTRRAFAAAGASWLFAWERVFAQERVDIPSANATLKTLTLDFEARTGTVIVSNNAIQPAPSNPVAKPFGWRLNVANVEAVYNSTTTPTGDALLTGLNKADLSAKSLERRIYERLIADGVITGTIAGVPK